MNKACLLLSLFITSGRQARAPLICVLLCIVVMLVSRALSPYIGASDRSTLLVVRKTAALHPNSIFATPRLAPFNPLIGHSNFVAH